MCGIAGYFGKKKILQSSINDTLLNMKQRGPEFSNYFIKSFSNNINIYLLHSRLSIIDLNPRSNQPFVIGDDVIVFNGEIYNFVELRNSLISKKVKLTTESDTEILLQYYKIYKEKCVDYFEGMWSFAIFNTKTQKLFLSRDRFAEKPLYYHEDNNGIFFGSEIKFLKSLSNKDFSYNSEKLNRFISLGYKSLFKTNDSFFIKIKKLLNAENLYCDNKFKINIEKYWNIKIKTKYEMTTSEAVEKTRELLINSVNLRCRSDVPLALSLSGGLDSAGLASIIVKKINSKIKTFSIVDVDSRYNEIDKIISTNKELACDSEIIELSKNNFLENFKQLSHYHDSPVATLTSYMSSLIAKSANNNGYKVIIGGNCSDELFGGYYDHYLLHLNAIKKSASYEKNLNYWKEYVSSFIRNPFYKDPSLFIKNPQFRDYVYDGRNEIAKYLLKAETSEFKEKIFTKKIFSNRRLNELFHETAPLILHQDDINYMKYSVENRSPFLDTKLAEFAFTIPEELLIQKGFNKYILRESLKGILADNIRLERRKKGFNASINSLLDFNSKEVKDYFLDSSSPIFDFVDLKKFEILLKDQKLPNHLSKFVFSVLSSKIFLESLN